MRVRASAPQHGHAARTAWAVRRVGLLVLTTGPNLREGASPGHVFVSSSQIFSSPLAPLTGVWKVLLILEKLSSHLEREKVCSLKWIA